MGKILLIEPSRILRQAITLALSPQHQVEQVQNVEPEALSPGVYDLVIADSDARSADAPMVAAVRRVEAAKTPTVWLEGEEGDAQSEPSHRVLRKPVERGALQAAIDEFLARGEPSKRPQSGGEGTHGEKVGSEPPERAGSPIELVDVVKEGPKPESKRAPRESR